MKERVRTLKEFVSKGGYFFQDPSEYDPKGVQKYWQKEDVVDSLERFMWRLASETDWNEDALETIFREMAEQKNVGLGKIIHPMRLALTGSTASPGLFEMMALLGKEAVIRRIGKALVYLKSVSFS
jgi:glutamyl-tRNA synthetase